MGIITEEVKKILDGAAIERAIISKPSAKSSEYKKIDIQGKAGSFQIAKYTQKQVFHENVKIQEL